MGGRGGVGGSVGGRRRRRGEGEGERNDLLWVLRGEELGRRRFRELCSGIGIQALVLPVALTILGRSTRSRCSSSFTSPPSTEMAFFTDEEDDEQCSTWFPKKTMNSADLGHFSKLKKMRD
ncbi:hypothetical protein CRG98_039284 [Punica granatum]|uniref:Uncharacterized protein n=1 Tax=Punica granatum TaxID=22663 RepID=A0A2I0I8J6_PUNGR|nr:hypothetical protein CRG98_039284 [Punica granatum]